MCGFTHHVNIAEKLPTQYVPQLKTSSVSAQVSVETALRLKTSTAMTAI